MVPKALIFDCDGTLLDSMDMWLSAEPKTLAAFGVETTREDFAETEHLSLPDECEVFHQRWGVGESGAEVLAKLQEIVVEAYETIVPIRPGVREFLAQAHDAGIPMAIASSTSPFMLDIALRHHGIREYFQNLSSTEEVAGTKADPDVFNLALERLGLDCTPDEVWVFEDMPFGLLGAKRGGYHTVGIYDPAGRAERSVLEEESDIFIESFEELALADLEQFEA